MISENFKIRIGVTPIRLSIFADRHGFWAKAWKDVVSIEIEFEDNVAVSLTPAEYQSLPADQQTLIMNAPSSPPL